MLKEFSSFLRAERGALALVAGHALGLAALTRGMTIDYWDGMTSRLNALLVWGAAPPQVELEVSRAVLSWLLASPLVAGAYAAGGPEAGFAAGRWAALLTVALSMAAAYALYRRFFTKEAALLLLAALALNPVLLQYAPSAIFDSFGFLPVAAFCAAVVRGSPALIFAAYLAAVCTRLHLSTLALSLVLLALTPAARGRRLALAAGPALAVPAYAGLLLAVSGLYAWTMEGSLREAVLRCHELLWRGQAAFNVIEQAPRGDWLYLRSLWSQLGPLGFGLCAVGFWSWLRSDKPAEAAPACVALASLAFLQLAVKNQEERYLLSYIPLYYAAAGRGAQILTASAPRRAVAVLAAAALAFLPWEKTARALRYLAVEPSLRGESHARLGGELAARLAPDQCAGWRAEDRYLMPSLVEPPTDEQHPLESAPALAFFSDRAVGAGCASEGVSVARGGDGALEVLSSN